MNATEACYKPCQYSCNGIDMTEEEFLRGQPFTPDEICDRLQVIHNGHQEGVAGSFSDTDMYTDIQTETTFCARGFIEAHKKLEIKRELQRRFGRQVSPLWEEYRSIAKGKDQATLKEWLRQRGVYVA